jgi:hypothetical protein
MGEPVNNGDWKEDVTILYLPFCEKQIDSHQSNIRFLTILTSFEILLGAALTILAFVIFRTDTAKISETIFKLGPSLFLAPFPAVQYHMISVSKQALSSYLTWRDRFQSSLENNTMPPDWLTKVVARNMGELVRPRKK